MHSPHPRDAYLEFEPLSHTYTVCGDGGYTSVTTWIHSMFPRFDSERVARRKLGSRAKECDVKALVDKWAQNGRESSSLGTDMHEAIELFYTKDQCLPETREIAMFKAFVDDHEHLKPYRSEWAVWDDEAKLAGTIDMVYQLDNGHVAIYDWKRCRMIRKVGYGGRTALHPAIDYVPDSNFWHYSLQLNVYRYMLESHYGLKVDHCALVQLHPEQKGYRVIRVPDLQADVATLYAERKNV